MLKFSKFYLNFRQLLLELGNDEKISQNIFLHQICKGKTISNNHIFKYKFSGITFSNTNFLESHSQELFQNHLLFHDLLVLNLFYIDFKLYREQSKTLNWILLNLKSFCVYIYIWESRISCESFLKSQSQKPKVSLHFENV